MTGAELPASLVITPLRGMPEVAAGDDLALLLLDALQRARIELADGDVVVLSSKLVSKAWGLRVDTAERPDGQHSDPDPEQLQALRRAVVEQESVRVVAERAMPGGRTQVVEALAGPVMAAAGIDASNTGPQGGLLLLPRDPDLAARQVYAGLLAAVAPRPLPRVGLVISDTSGRPWRSGQVDFALGSCGVQVLEDLRGGADADGRELSVTARAVADELAAAADLVKGKAEAVPAAHVRGLRVAGVGDVQAAGARSLVRTGPQDWFSYGAVEAVRAALGAAPGSAASEQVGVPSLLPEERAAHVDRAVRLALLGSACSADCVSRRDPAHLEVSCADPVARGRLAARLEVALAAEGTPGRVTLVETTDS